MSKGPDVTDAITVEEDGVTVEKRFTADEFPVPAIEFTLRSDREEPTEFSLVDEIPQDFPMDRIGFHPEYESEHWTAYQDHRVEYRRRLEAGEEVITVYGIRTDDPDNGDRFLGEPMVDEVSEDDDPVGDVADVIGDDSSQAVRDVLTGNDAGDEPADGDVSDGLDFDEDEAGADTGGDDAVAPLAEEPSDDALEPTKGRMESESGSDLLDTLGEDEASGEETETLGAADEHGDDDALGVAETDDGLDLGESASDDEPDAAIAPDADTVSAAGDADPNEDSPETAEPEASEASAVSEETEVPAETPGDEPLELDDEPARADDIGAADEAGEEAVTDEAVAEDDTGAGADESTEPAAGGVAAGGIAAALAEELRAGSVSEADKEVLKQELELDHSTSVDARISRLQSKVEDMAAYSNALEEFIDENGLASEWMDGLQADLDELTADIAETRSEVADAGDDRESLREEVESVREDAHSATEEATAVREEMDDLSGDVDDLGEEVDELGEEVADTAESLESSLDAVRDEFDDLAEEVADEDEAVADVREELASLGDEVESVSALVDDELSEMRSELTDVHDDLEEFEEFRTRLSSVFGPGGAADAAGADDTDADEQ